MPKERSINPAQAQRKAEKQREIAKNKKNTQSQRNEKLARRNPERLQKQIDELKELESRGVLRPKDKETLSQLERDVKGIRKAREVLGDAAPRFPVHDRGDGGGSRQEQRERRQNLGKRRRDEDDPQSSDTDPEVRDISMPRDTPPPIPRQERRPLIDPQVGPDGVRVPHALPNKPVILESPQLVYSSAPQLRDLKKEATKFVPSVVAQKKKQIKGQGRLLEPEEIDKLEKAGYYSAARAAAEAGEESELILSTAQARVERSDVDMDAELKRLESELNEAYSATKEGLPSRHVTIEDVEDEGG